MNQNKNNKIPVMMETPPLRVTMEGGKSTLNRTHPVLQKVLDDFKVIYSAGKEILNDIHK